MDDLALLLIPSEARMISAWTSYGSPFRGCAVKVGLGENVFTSSSDVEK
jgi:hypothetical protein